MNILIIAMSQLPKDTIKASKCRWVDDEGNEREMIYYSQLEPITRMLMEQGNKPDEVVVLCTEESCIPVSFKVDGMEEDWMESPLTFYEKRIEAEKNGIDIIKIPAADGEYIDASSLDSKRKAVAEIAKYVLHKKTPDLKIWIDTQGGLRDISLLTNAIFSLLKPSDIVPVEIYSLNKDKDNCWYIMKQKEMYQVFDFVSGMNEFIEYGRADQLVAYYNKINVEIPPIVETMRNLANAIMVCNIDEFDKQLIKLKDRIKSFGTEKKNEKNDQIFSVFIDQIKRDYKNILNENTNRMDVVEWFLSKKLYQQTLTYIESKIPEEWEKKGALIFEIDNKIEKEHIRGENPNILTDLLNRYIGILLYVKKIRTEEGRWNILNNKQIPLNNKEDNKKARIDKNKSYVFDYTINKKNNNKTSLKITVSTKVMKKILLYKQIALYKLIKEERNKWNHMLNGNRMQLDELNAVIREFIKNGRKLYDSIEQ